MAGKLHNARGFVASENLISIVEFDNRNSPTLETKPVHCRTDT